MTCPSLTEEHHRHFISNEPQPSPCAQVLKAGDAVVAAARKPEGSPGLTKLKQEHGAALQLVKLDMNDGASLKVYIGPECC